MVFKTFGCLVKEKFICTIIVKFLLATLKTLTNSKDWSSSSFVIFSSAHDITGFRSTFQNHRAFEITWESQAATWKSEQVLRRRLLDGFSEASRNSNIYFFKKERPVLCNPSALIQKVLIWYLGPSKKMIARHHTFEWKFTYFAMTA
jgi:hypothetical protein